MTIRLADERDVESIAKLEPICFSDPWSYDMVKSDLVDNSLSDYYVAEEDGEIVGYIGFWWFEGECQINNVAVIPEMRERGIGRILVEKVLSYTEDRGVHYWNLEVRAGNNPAINLYKSLGFEIAGDRKAYYEDGEDAYIMIRIIVLGQRGNDDQ